jgi:hypothetical protein
MCPFSMLADGAVVFDQFFKDICHITKLLKLTLPAKLKHLTMLQSCHYGR